MKLILPAIIGALILSNCAQQQPGDTLRDNTNPIFKGITPVTSLSAPVQSSPKINYSGVSGCYYSSPFVDDTPENDLAAR